MEFVLATITVPVILDGKEPAAQPVCMLLYCSVLLMPSSNL